jgi:hypothetical protein
MTQSLYNFTPYRFMGEFWRMFQTQSMYCSTIGKHVNRKTIWIGSCANYWLQKQTRKPTYFINTTNRNRARICKRLRSLRIDSKESISPAYYVACGPVRQIGLSYRPVRLGIDSWAPEKVYNLGLKWLYERSFRPAIFVYACVPSAWIISAIGWLTCEARLEIACDPPAACLQHWEMRTWRRAPPRNRFPSRRGPPPWQFHLAWRNWTRRIPAPCSPVSLFKNTKFSKDENANSLVSSKPFLFTYLWQLCKWRELNEEE